MRNTFYGKTSNNIFSSQIRINKNIKREHIPLDIFKNKNFSFNKENLELPNDSNNKSYKKINKNILNKNSKEDKSYIFYGNNKIFKPKNINISAYNISAKYKNMNKGQNLDDKNYSNISNNNYKFKEFTSLPRQLSDDMLLNKRINNNPKIKSNFFINNDFFPDINILNKKRNENDLNINYLFNYDNNQKSQIEQLNQLHKNFINSFKNTCGKSDDIDKINNFNLFNENKNTINKIKKNNLFESSKFNKRWMNDNIIDKKIKINERNKKDEEIKFTKNNSININSYYKDREKMKLIQDKDKYLRKINNYQLLKQNNIKVNNNIKKSEIKKNIEKYFKGQKKTINSKESINFSNIDNNKSDSNENKDKNALKIDNINPMIPQYKTISHKNNIIKKINSYIKQRDKNLSYISSKNMSIEESLGVDPGKNNKFIKNNEKMINDSDKKEKEKEKEKNIKEEENSNVKFNFKTTTNFFSSKFKKDENIKKDSLDIKNIIKNVIENNKRASIARDSTNFYIFENLYINNKMRKSQKNFYSSSYFKKDTNFTKEQAKDTTSNSNKKCNYIQLALISPKEWEKHEEIWMNILNANEKVEKYILPPNDMDILVSGYLKMYPQKLNICNLSKVNSFSKTQKEFLSFYIDDDIENPRNEIKKWKNAYKKMILRWHPDKLFPLINELKVKNEFIKKELERRSSLIVNNVNTLYQNIIEILKKILLNKEKLECNNK